MANILNPPDPPPVVIVPPNQSSLFLDSRFRTLNDSPYDFSTPLTAGLTARQLAYRNLYWSAPFFTHNLDNIEILLRFLGDDRKLDGNYNPYTYVAYMQPWIQTISFDGHDGNYTSFMQDPLPGSYAHYLQTSLNDLRRRESNLAAYKVTVDGGHPISAVVRYNPARGFVIYFLNDDTGDIVPFDILDCDWIKNGHFIHGYGIFDPATNMYRPLFYDDLTLAYKRAYYSDATPQLLYTRYLIVVSKELCRDRRVQSFASSHAADDFPSEIAVIPTTYQKVGVFHVESTGENATIIPIREGNQPQYLRITMEDENGQTLISGDPIGNFLSDTNVPSQIITDFFDESLGFQSTNLLNYLIFQKQFNPSPDSRTDPEVVDSTMFVNTTPYIIGIQPLHYDSPECFLPFETWYTNGLLDGNETVDANVTLWGSMKTVTQPTIVAHHSPEMYPHYVPPIPDPAYLGKFDPYIRLSLKNNVPQTMTLTLSHWADSNAGNYTIRIRIYPFNPGYPKTHPYAYTTDTPLFTYHVTPGDSDFFYPPNSSVNNPYISTVIWDIDHMNISDKYPNNEFYISAQIIQYSAVNAYYTPPLHSWKYYTKMSLEFRRKYIPPPTYLDPPPPPPIPTDPVDNQDPPTTVNDIYVYIPKETYPYAKYNTVLLDDDVIHDISVLSSF